MSEKPRTITGVLRRQHESFGLLLTAMGEALKGDNPAGRLQGPLGRLVPALIVHERIEHELLFPAMLSHVAGIDPGVLDLFKETHKEIHERLEALQEALGDKSALLSRLVTAVDFISLLREHFEQEEGTLFPLFERRAPRGVQEELGLKAEEYAAAARQGRRVGGTL